MKDAEIRYKSDLEAIASEHRDIADIVGALERRDIGGISKKLFNAFELVISDDKITDAKNALIKSSAVGSLMTGSGSAVFGIYDSAEKSKQAYEIIKKEKYEAYLCESKSKGIEIINKG